MSKPSWPKQYNKLFVSGFSPNLPDEELRLFCEESGNFIHMYRTKCKTQIFLTYKNETAAAMALKKFNDRLIHVDYANDKRNGSISNDSISSPESPLPQESSPPIESSPPEESSPPNELPPPKESKGLHVTFEENLKVNSSPQSNSKALTFKSGEEVIITHVKGNGEFYARPKSMETVYNNSIKTVDESGKTSERLDHLPKQEEFVLTPYGSHFRRGIIQNNINSKDERAVVSLLDYGMRTEVPIEELRKYPENLNLKRLTYKFILDGCVFNTNDSYAENCFKTLTGASFKMEHDNQFIEQKSYAKLIDTHTGLCINDLLKQMTCTFTVDKLVFQSAPVGIKKSIVVIDPTKLQENGDNLITFVDRKNQLKFYQQRNRINAAGEIFERFPKYEPTVDELCVVNYNDFWYRAQFVEKCDKSAIVFLLDVQKGVEVALENIRKITNDFVEMPILTFTAMLRGRNKKITDQKELVTLIGKMKLNETINVKCVSISELTKDIYEIDL